MSDEQKTIEPSETPQNKPVPPVETAENLEAPPAPIPQRYRYRIIMRPNDAIKDQVGAIVEDVRIDRQQSVDMMQWQANFQCKDEAALIENIQQWVDEHLPIQTQTEKVFSAVFGTQTYVAGWHLSQAEQIRTAQQALTQNLADLIDIEVTANTNFYPRYLATANVSAERFPAVVAHLQQHFEPSDWTMQAVELQRQSIDEGGRPLPNSKWEKAQDFKTKGQN